MRNKVVLAPIGNNSHSALLESIGLEDTIYNAATKFVRAELVPVDGKDVVNAMNQYIDEHEGVDVRFSLDGINRTKIDDLMKVFITDRGFLSDGKGNYSSDFDACYGWDRVMYEMFEFIAPYLEDGSKFCVYPDSGHWLLVVKNGKAVLAEEEE